MKYVTNGKRVGPIIIYSNLTIYCIGHRDNVILHLNKYKRGEIIKMIKCLFRYATSVLGVRFKFTVFIGIFCFANNTLVWKCLIYLGMFIIKVCTLISSPFGLRKMLRNAQYKITKQFAFLIRYGL